MARSDLTIEILAKIRQAQADLKAVEQSIDGVEDSVGSLDDQLRQAQQGFESLRGPALAAVGAVTAGAVGATAAWSSYQTQMVQVQNITEASSSAMEGMSQRIMGMDSHLGEADDLMRGLYQTISSGITDSEDAFKVLTSSAMASKGNIADLTTTVDAATSFLNAYGLEASQVDSVLDAMTKTVDIGKLTFEELANNIGKTVATAAQSNVTYQELMATMATLTLNGLSVEEATTAINNILRVMIKPTQQEAEAMASVSLEMNTATLAAKGLGGVMAEVAEAVNGSAEATAMLFPNMRAMRGAMQLATEKGANQLRDSLDAVGDSAGKNAANFARASQTMEQETQALTAELKKLGIEFGELLSEDITPAIRGLTEFAGVLRDLDEPTKRNAISMAEYTAAVGGFILVAPVLIRALQTIGAAAGVSAGALGILASAGAAAVLVITEIGTQYEKAADRQLHAAIQQEQSSEAFKRSLEGLGATWQDYATNQITSLGILQKYIETEDGLVTSQGKLGDLARKYRDEMAKLNRERSAAIHGTEEQVKAHEKLMDRMAGVVDESADLADNLGDVGDAANRSSEAVVFLGTSLSGNLAIAIDQVRAAVERQHLEQAALWEGLREDVQGAADDFGEVLSEAESFHLVLQGIGETPIPAFITEFGQYTDDLGLALRDSIAHGLGEGLATGFEDFSLDDFAGQFSSAIGQALGAGLQGVMSGQPGAWQALGGMFGLGGTQTAGQRMLGGLGGLSMMYQGSQQGGVGGFLTGAMGGAMGGGMLGTMLAGAAGGPIGMAIGALVGGIMSLFGGGTETPWFSTQYTAGSGFDVTRSGGHMGFSEERRTVFEREMNRLVEGTQAAWLQVLTQFEMPELFDLVGTMRNLTFGGFEGTTDDFARWFGEEILPEQMEQMFRAAIDLGMQRIGVSDARIQQIWDEMSGMDISGQTQFLSDYIGAVVRGAELLEDLDWSSIMDAVSQTPREAFVSLMESGLEEIDTLMASMEFLDLEDQIGAWNQISDISENALGTIITYLQQVDQLAQQIERSISGQIEGLRLSQMTEGQQAQYIATQLSGLFTGLGADGLDPNQIAQMTSDAQGYISMLQQLMGDRAGDYLGFLFQGPMGGQGWLQTLGGGDLRGTGTDFLIQLLEHLQGLSSAALADVTADAQAQADEYLQRQLALQEAMTGTEITLNDTSATTKILNDEFTRLTSTTDQASAAMEKVAAMSNAAADALAMVISVVAGAAAATSSRYTSSAADTPRGTS